MKIRAIMLASFMLAIIGMPSTVLAVHHNLFHNPVQLLKLPAASIAVDADVEYIGKIEFEMMELVKVTLHIFLEMDGDNISSMMVIQSETVLNGVDYEYVWPTTNPVRLGEHDYQHNRFYFDTASAIENNPGKETDMTARYLADQGLPAVSGWVASRYARITDDEGRSELIIFYMEPVEATGHAISDFANGDGDTELWLEFSDGLAERASDMFEIDQD